MPFKFWIYAAVYFILLSCNSSVNKSTIKNDSSKLYVSSSTTEASLKSIIPSYDNKVSTLGIGLIIVPDKFVVYDDSLLNKKFRSIDMYGDERAINVYSKFYKPDYGIMHFVCVQATEKYYK